MTLVLASTSPRRRELLARLTSDFIVVPGEADETASGSPDAQAIGAALAKARSVASRNPGVIIGADTIVLLDGRILGKPRSKEEAREMLSQLSGRDHAVLTGLCVISTWTGEERSVCERTTVRFRRLPPDEIEAYLESGEYLGKAGAYGIQGRAGAFVTGIEGDYHNVMGLPLCRLVLLLREMGIRV